MNSVGIEPLQREDMFFFLMIRRPPRIPLVRAKWWGEGLKEQYGTRLEELERYPEDVAWLFITNPVNPDRMNLSWNWKTETARDRTCVIDDWGKLDEFIAKLPTPETDPAMDALKKRSTEARRLNRYTLFGWWNLFFERPWMLRGMDNLMCDYYVNPDYVRRLHDALCRTYRAYIETAVREFNPDGFWSSDDLGHQTAAMISPDTFRTMLLPFYRQVSDVLKKHKLHFWLHSCGCNTPLLPDLIAGGVNVFHPVQKYTMDEQAVAAQFGEKLTFLAGIDVQHTLQEKTSEQVREEVRFLIDTFDRPDGGLCLAAGNGIVAGTPFENIEAFLDEAVRYGTARRDR